MELTKKKFQKKKSEHQQFAYGAKFQSGSECIIYNQISQSDVENKFPFVEIYG